MNKVELVEIVKKLVRNKVEYYKILGAYEVVEVDEVIQDIYNDLVEYMEDEIADYIANLIEFDILHMMASRDC